MFAKGGKGVLREKGVCGLLTGLWAGLGAVGGGTCREGGGLAPLAVALAVKDGGGAGTCTTTDTQREREGEVRG